MVVSVCIYVICFICFVIDCDMLLLLIISLTVFERFIWYVGVMLMIVRHVV